MTTLVDVEDSLPSGLHDARLESLTISAEKGELSLELRIDGVEPPNRARITLIGVASLQFEAAGDLLGVMRDPRMRRLDAGAGRPAQARTSAPIVPEGYFQHWFFIEGWNGFILVVAREARLEWLGDLLVEAS